MLSCRQPSSRNHYLSIYLFIYPSIYLSIYISIEILDISALRLSPEILDIRTLESFVQNAGHLNPCIFHPTS
jgi:hypothetical protein